MARISDYIYKIDLTACSFEHELLFDIEPEEVFQGDLPEDKIK